MRAQDNQTFTDIAASTAPFPLKGGKYGVEVVATFGGGSVHLQVVAPDGETLVDASSATNFTANGYATIDLPPGMYQFTVTTATAVYASASRVPVGLADGDPDQAARVHPARLPRRALHRRYRISPAA